MKYSRFVSTKFVRLFLVIIHNSLFFLWAQKSVTVQFVSYTDTDVASQAVAGSHDDKQPTNQKLIYSDVI